MRHRPEFRKNCRSYFNWRNDIRLTSVKFKSFQDFGTSSSSSPSSSLLPSVKGVFVFYLIDLCREKKTEMEIPSFPINIASSSGEELVCKDKLWDRKISVEQTVKFWMLVCVCLLRASMWWWSTLQICLESYIRSHMFINQFSQIPEKSGKLQRVHLFPI